MLDIQTNLTVTECRSVVAWGQGWKDGLQRAQGRFLRWKFHYVDYGDDFACVYIGDLTVHFKYVQFIYFNYISIIL